MSSAQRTHECAQEWSEFFTVLATSSDLSLEHFLKHLFRPRETEGGKRIKVSGCNYKDSNTGSEASLALPSYCRKTVLSAEWPSWLVN